MDIASSCIRLDALKSVTRTHVRERGVFRDGGSDARRVEAGVGFLGGTATPSQRARGLRERCRGVRDEIDLGMEALYVFKSVEAVS